MSTLDPYRETGVAPCGIRPGPYQAVRSPRPTPGVPNLALLVLYTNRWNSVHCYKTGFLKMLTLQWVRSEAGMWLPLETFDLATASGDGVYVIWHAGQPARTVKVGQGNICNRLSAHRADTAITTYRRFGTLYVTWANVAAIQRNAVERYLGDYLKPLVASRFPDVLPVAVNSPFA